MCARRVCPVLGQRRSTRSKRQPGLLSLTPSHMEIILHEIASDYRNPPQAVSPLMSRLKAVAPNFKTAMADHGEQKEFHPKADCRHGCDPLDQPEGNSDLARREVTVADLNRCSGWRNNHVRWDGKRYLYAVATLPGQRERRLQAPIRLVVRYVLKPVHMTQAPDMHFASANPSRTLTSSGCKSRRVQTCPTAPACACSSAPE